MLTTVALRFVPRDSDDGVCYRTGVGVSALLTVCRALSRPAIAVAFDRAHPSDFLDLLAAQQATTSITGPWGRRGYSRSVRAGGSGSAKGHTDDVQAGANAHVGLQMEGFLCLSLRIHSR